MTDQFGMTLEEFQDFEITGPPDAMARLRETIAAQLAPPWSEVPEERRRKVDEGMEFLAYDRAGDDLAPDAGVFLMRFGNAFRVTNIVPAKNGSLGIVLYNRILEDFVDRVAKPVSERLGLTMDLSSPDISMEDSLGDEPARRLKLFSAAANMSSGSSHPLDRARWYDFILSSSDRRIDSGILGRWLQTLGWDEDSAHRLVSEFEFGHGLIVRERDPG